MLLAIDIGNTNTVFGIFHKTQLQHNLRLATRANQTSDEIGLMLSNWFQQIQPDKSDIDSLIISSVVPSLVDVYEKLSEKHFGKTPLLVSARVNLPITIDIDQPEQAGSDRIANAVAAYSIYNGPVIVVDFGTATNFDVVNSGGAYIGGVLLPGPESSMAELARHAARLYEVGIERPGKVVGRSTTEALMSGAFYGTLGQVDYIIEKIVEETGFKSETIIATGGLAERFVKYSRYIKKTEPNLTLEGLRIISDYNKKSH